MEYLEQVIEWTQRRAEVKPCKCSFIGQEVEYLSHIVTPQGLKTTPKLVLAVKEFPTSAIQEKHVSFWAYLRTTVDLFHDLPTA